MLLGMVNEFSLTLVCDLDLGHMNLDLVHCTLSCSGHLCFKLFYKWTKDVFISSALEPNFPLDLGLSP